MSESSAVLPRGWRYGMHPQAVGLEVRALGRVELPLGEALRLEMVAADDAGHEDVHLQYYIDTKWGGWALWLSGPRSDVAAREAALREVAPPSEGDP